MDTELRIKLEVFQEKSGMSATKIAQGIGIGASTISEWKNDKYKGDVETLESKIADYLKRHEDPAKRIDFCVMTETTKKIFYVINTVAEYVASATRAGVTESAKIGFITGRAGLGKSWSLQEYKKNHDNKIIFITAEAGDNENVLLRKIAKEIKITDFMYGRMQAVKEKIKERLKNSEKIIVVDEGEHLTARAIDCIRAIGDQTGVGIVIAGTNKLEGQITSGRNEYEYLYSRTVIFMKLSDLNEADTKEIAGQYLGGRYDENELEKLSKMFHKASKGSARNLSNLLALATKITSMNIEHTKGKINNRVIDEASKMLGITV